MKHPRYLAFVVFLAMLLSACETTGVRSERKAETADIYTQLGISYMREGQLDVALQKLQRAVEIDPHHASAHNVLGVVYERLGDDTLAERHFRASVRAWGKDPRAHNNYGRLLCRLGRYEEAEKNFLAAAENHLYASPEVAYSNAGNCAQRIADVVKAENYFRRALRANPKFPIALLRMAQITRVNKHYLPSRAYLQRYLEVASHTPETLWLGILNERELGDRDAVASYSLLLRANFPDSEEVEWLKELETDDTGIHP